MAFCSFVTYINKLAAIINNENNDTMGKIPSYNSFEEKNVFYLQDKQFPLIDTIEDFDKWYRRISNIKIISKDEKLISKYRDRGFFRGMGDAKHKLFSSAQRLWITNELNDRPANDYFNFFQRLVDSASDTLLLKKVFEYYNIHVGQRDFPLLSILQHYGAPTPLMDWTYNVDVALYFATEKNGASYSNNPIDQYFSIYYIDKSKQKPKELNNIFDWNSGHFPKLVSFADWQNSVNAIFYISDFENDRTPNRGFRDVRPMTTYYNQNILPQEGLFIFSPYPKKPLEECFKTDHYKNGNNLELNPFTCYNIKKDLSEYIRHKIKFKDIDNAFIYPELRRFCTNLTEQHLYNMANGLV